jgi:hexosaminidase
MTFAVYILLFAPLASAIWPIPTHYEHGEKVLSISRDVLFSLSGTNEELPIQKQIVYDDNHEFTWSGIYIQPEENRSKHRKRRTSDENPLSGEDLIRYAIDSAQNTIFKKSFVPWKFHPRNWTEPGLSNVPSISRVDLKLLQNDPEDSSNPLAGNTDESYDLSLTEDGEATISANSSVGIIRGLTTFTQLFFQHTPPLCDSYTAISCPPASSAAYTTLAPVSITDIPKFSHRGLNLDVSRHFFPTRDIKRTIDALAYNKMNRLHLHITDSQSWPLEIPSLPRLAAKGAFQPNLVYTVEDFEELQYHAAIQGIQLITEIDMPGHTSSIYHSNPDLVAAFDIQPDHSTYAAEPPSGTLKLNSSAVYEFLETLFDDLLPRIRHYSSYFHTGGDEVNKNAYLLDDTVRSKDPAILQPLMQKFIDRNHGQLRKKGLTPIVWEEMLLEWDLTLGKDVVVQSWRSDEAVKQIVEKGHKALVGNYMYWVISKSPTLLSICCPGKSADNDIVSRLWQRPMAESRLERSRPVPRLYVLFHLQCLPSPTPSNNTPYRLRSIPQLARHLLLRSPRQHSLLKSTPRSWRRSPPLGRADRSIQPRSNALAARSCRCRSPLERSDE